MAGYFLDINLDYYEGDEQPGSTPVPRRPDHTYAWDEENGWVPTVATQQPFKDAIGAWMDAQVQQRGYDSILSACSYAQSTNQQFQAESLACIQWRDAVWQFCYDALAAIQSGQAQMPTIESFIATLPRLTWPS